MKNVIEMENHCNSVDGYRILQRNDESEFVEALYMYDDEEGLVGTNKLLNGKEFASIQVVQDEMEELQEIIEFDEIIPWGDGGLIICQEGVFIWDWETEKYVWGGELEKTLRKKVVYVLKDAVVNMGSSYIPIERGSSFLLDGEYVANDDKLNPVVMLAISPIGCVPLAVPYDEDVFIVRERDLAVIDFFE